jgi:hypothetical protein
LYSNRGSLPERPVSAINDIKKSIQYLEYESVDAISELVKEYQVFNSRLDSFHQTEPQLRSRDNIQCADRIYDVILLHHYILRVFCYARMEKKILENKKPTKQDLLSALKQLIKENDYNRTDNIYQKTIDCLAATYSWRSL